MGPPYIKKDRLYAFFDGYTRATQDSARRQNEYNANEQSISLLNKISGLWPREEPATLGEEAPTKRVASGFSKASNITDDEIEQHVLAYFTQGVEAAEGSSKLHTSEFASDIQFMHEDERAYGFFLFWLDQPANEWLDAFLFEVADKWGDVRNAKERNAKLSQAAKMLETPSFRDLDDLYDLMKSGVLDGEDEMHLNALMEELEVKRSALSYATYEIRDFISSKQVPELISTDLVQVTNDFFYNGYLMKRVSENKKNIGSVRYALRELGLGDES